MRKRVLSFFLCTTSLMVLQANAGTTKTLPKEKIGVLLKNYVLQNKAKNVSYPTQPYMESFDVDDSKNNFDLLLAQLLPRRTLQQSRLSSTIRSLPVRCLSHTAVTILQ